MVLSRRSREEVALATYHVLVLDTIARTSSHVAAAVLDIAVVISLAFRIIMITFIWC